MSVVLGLSSLHETRFLESLDKKKKAKVLFFRMIGPRLQEKFADLIAIDKTPKLLLHGNPHLDNYAVTSHGAGMIDFDRSKVGPYSWDIVRFFSSLIIKSERVDLHADVIESLHEAYLRALYGLSSSFGVPSFLLDEVNKMPRVTYQQYLKTGKWFERIKDNMLNPHSDEVLGLLFRHFESRNESSLFKKYEIEKVGKSEGSMGIMHYIYALKDTSSNTEGKVIDIKQVYQESSVNGFLNPYEHNAVRMIEASELYAPGLEKGMSAITYRGEQFWGREIPYNKLKIKGTLNKAKQIELAQSVGTQLGYAHGKQANEETKLIIKNDLTQRLEDYSKIASFLVHEIELAYDYMRKSYDLRDQVLSDINEEDL